MSENLDDVPGLVCELYDLVARFEEMFPTRKFTPDGHLVGSLGEGLAAYTFDLDRTTPSTRGHDAMAGELRVEVKATQGRSVALRAEPDPLLHRLLVLQLHKDGDSEIAYNGPADPPWMHAGPPQSNGQRSISVKKLAELMDEVPDNLQLPQRRSLPTSSENE